MSPADDAFIGLWVHVITLMDKFCRWNRSLRIALSFLSISRMGYSIRYDCRVLQF